MACRCRNKRICDCKGSTGAFVTETVNKVITVPIGGVKGDAGDRVVFVYQLSDQDVVAPNIPNTTNPLGWSTTPLQTTDELPYRWTSQAYLNSGGTLLVTVWSVPVVDVRGLESVTPIFSDSLSDI